MAGMLLLLACGRTARPGQDEAPEPPASGSSSGGSEALGAAEGGRGPTVGGSAGSPAGSGAGGLTNSAGGPADGGSGGAPPCEASALQITGGQVLDDDGDGLFESLEQVHVSADLVSPLSAATVKLSVASDDPEVQLVEGGMDGVRLERTLQLEAGVPLHIKASYVITERVSAGSEIGFKLTLAGLVDGACVLPAAEERVITVKNYVWQDDTCDMTRQIEISNPHVVDSQGTSSIQPGEDFELRVTLSPGPLGHNNYPGIVVSSDDPGVSELDGGWLFALVGPTEVVWNMHAAPELEAGTVVNLSLVAAAMHVRCRDVKPFVFSLPIE